MTKQFYFKQFSLAWIRSLNAKTVNSRNHSLVLFDRTFNFAFIISILIIFIDNFIIINPRNTIKWPPHPKKKKPWNLSKVKTEFKNIWNWKFVPLHFVLNHIYPTMIYVFILMKNKNKSGSLSNVLLIRIITVEKFTLPLHSTFGLLCSSPRT